MNRDSDIDDYEECGWTDDEGHRYVVWRPVGDSANCALCRLAQHTRDRNARCDKHS